MNLSNTQDVSMVGLDSLLFINCGDIFTESILVLWSFFGSFGNVNVSYGILRLPSIKRTGCQLDHLRYVAVNFSSSTTILHAVDFLLYS